MRDSVQRDGTSGRAIGNFAAAMKPFDYIFYRVATFYRDRWKVSEPERFGAGVVFVLHGTTLFGLFLIFVTVAGHEYWQYSKPVALASGAVLYILDIIWYYNRSSVAKYERQFGNESPTQRRNRGILMKLYAFISIATPIVYGILKHNLHWI